MSKAIAPVSPGEMLQEEFLAPLGMTQIPAGQKHRRTRPAHWRYHFWQARNYGGYGLAPVPFLWIVRWLVAAAAGEPRYNDCEEENGGEVGEDCAVGECGMTRTMAALRPTTGSNCQCLAAAFDYGC